MATFQFQQFTRFWGFFLLFCINIHILLLLMNTAAILETCPACSGGLLADMPPCAGLNPAPWRNNKQDL